MQPSIINRHACLRHTGGFTAKLGKNLDNVVQRKINGLIIQTLKSQIDDQLTMDIKEMKRPILNNYLITCYVTLPVYIKITIMCRITHYVNW